ncbi:MAG: DUF1674 domain-containing protein [Sandaracinobacteroides sp.]
MTRKDTPRTPQSTKVPQKTAPQKPAPQKPSPQPEVGGRQGPEPTRYGDWEVKGICSDF